MKDRARRVRRIVFWSIFGLIVLTMLVFNVPLRVNRTVTALEISLDDPNHIAERTVILDGWWHLNIFEHGRVSPHHQFSGRIEIVGYPETDELGQPVVVWPLISRSHFGPIFYREEYPALVRRERGFRITTGFLFRNAAIEVFDWNWVECEHGSGARATGENHRFIVLNATTREEAIEILRWGRPWTDFD